MKRNRPLFLLTALTAVTGWGAATWLFTHPRVIEAPASPVAATPPPVAVAVPVPVAVPDPVPPAVPAPPRPDPVPAPVVKNPFEDTFLEWSARPEFAGALVGFCLVDAEGNAIYQSPLAETALCPASAMKTLTTGAAFAMLGTDFRFRTTLAATAPVRRGTVDGDLVLTGSGDPTLDIPALEAMADAAVAAGLKRVTGVLVADTSVFANHPPMSDHWNRGDTGNAYGAGAYGVNVDHNRVTLVFDPGAQEGDAAKFLGSAPPLAGIDWNVRVLTGPAGSGDRVMVYSEPYGRRIEARGTIPLGERGFGITAAIPDPPALAVQVLRARLAKAGVTFGTRATFTTSGASRTTLATRDSPPLPEIIDHLHKVSDNLESQVLFLTMGNLKKADPATVIRRHWESQGVTFRALRMEDGSGLARATMIRPIDLARVNAAARRAPTGARYYESLNSVLDGRVRAKLGSMSGVKTETGFLRLPDGREAAFALMANGLSPDVNFWALRGTLLAEVMKAR